jgi:hypothetical protein
VTFFERCGRAEEPPQGRPRATVHRGGRRSSALPSSASTTSPRL